MSSALIWIVVIGLVAWFWLDSARARELAIGIAESMCVRRDLQFLDETVGLQRVALRRTPDGLRIRRLFGFDFSIEGVGRRRGYIILIGTRVEQFGLDLPPEPHPAAGPPPRDQFSAQPQPDPERKVIPFRRPPTRH